MAKDKAAGIIIYPEDLARIKRCVKPQYQFAVVMALSRYASEGVAPTEEELGEGGMVAFEFIIDKVRDALEAYEKGRQQRQEAIRKRWGKSDTEDTDEYDRIRPNTAEYKTETETETVNRNTETEAEVDLSNSSVRTTAAAADDGIVLGIDGSDMTDALRDHQTAERLVGRYMPAGRTPIEFDPRTGEIATLIADHGADKVEEALQKAVASDNRGGVSVAFVRAILKGTGKPRAAPTNYQKRQYSETDYDSVVMDWDSIAEEEARKR